MQEPAGSLAGILLATDKTEYITMNDLDFHCGIGEKSWNGFPVAPGPLACIAPVYGRAERTRRKNSVSVPTGVQVIQDSGAFSDGPQSRQSIVAAHERQVAHGEQYGYTSQITHRASYDLLIDETWQDGKRTKKRWSWSEAQAAVDETVAAAAYMAKHKDRRGAVLSAQGVTSQQYYDCALRVMDYIDPETDILGLGGWCITGIIKYILPVFEDTVALVIPQAAKHGIRRVHIWGVVYADALARLLWMCDQHDIRLSTDSQGPSLRPVNGQWGYADWVDKSYSKPPPSIMGLERARHVKATRDWLSRLSQTQYYLPPRRSNVIPIKTYHNFKQMPLFGMVR